MTEPAAPDFVNPAHLSPSRALAHALFAALVVAHVQPLFVSGAVLAPDFTQHYTVALPLVAAEWVHDFVWLGVLGGAVAFAATRAGAHSDTLRALLLATLAALLAGLGMAARLELGGVGTWGIVAGAAGASYAAFGLASRVSPFGFAFGVVWIAVGCGYANAIPVSAEMTALNHLSVLAVAWGAVHATRSLRAPMALFALVVAIALGAIVESNWLASRAAASAPSAARDAESTASPTAGSAPNLVVISLDTFRADAFDPREDGNTPHLAAFAQQARVSEEARSTSSWTLPGHASLFTGSYPTTHGAHFLPRGTSEREAGVLGDANTTLAELLRDRGYATWGIVANHAYLHADTRIDQGFAVWDDRHALGRGSPAALSELTPRLAGLGALDRFARWVGQLDEAQRQYLRKTYRLADDVVSSAVALLDRERSERPFFLFLNFMEAHAPYVPQAHTRSQLGDALVDRWLDLHDGLGGVDPNGPGGPELMRGERDLTDEERAHLEAAYRGEVHDLDAALGALFDALRERGHFEDSWIVVTADHGEFLGEHRLLGHASELYEEAIRVPLILRAPAGADSRPIEGRVQLVDVLPSLAPHFGLSLPAQVDGLAFDDVGPRAAVAEQFEYPQFVDTYGPRFAGDRRAWIEASAALYAFTQREDEWRARSDSASATALQPESRARMRRELSEWVGARAPVSKGLAQPELSPEERRRLEQLGYL